MGGYGTSALRWYSWFGLHATCGVPLFAIKTAGGDRVACVGCELVHSSFSVGISQRWTNEVATSEAVNLSHCEEGVWGASYTL